MPIRPQDLAQWWNRAPDGQVVVDEQGVILAVNRCVGEWFGVPTGALADTPASDLFTPAARLLYLGLVGYRLAERGRVEEVHLELPLPSGQTLPVLCSARRIDYKGARLSLLGLMPIDRKHRLERELLEGREATDRLLAEKGAIIAELQSLQATLEARRQELEALNRRLDHEAMTDALTGLPNRRRFDRVLGGLLAQVDTDALGGGFTLALLDVDHFKAINDRFGHAAGDRVLETLARLLHDTLRGDDLAARIGGEEFVLLMPNTSPEDARCPLERLRTRVQQHQWQGIPVTLSIGLAGHRPGDTAAGLLERADRALYAAKQGGRNRIVMG